MTRALSLDLRERVVAAVERDGLIAAILLLAGGLAALQSATIASALPFSLIMLVLIWALFKGMRADVAQRQVGRTPTRRAG